MEPDALATLIEQILNAETDEARQEAFSAVTDLDTFETEMTEIAGGLVGKSDASAEDLDTAAALADALEHLRNERARRLAVETAETDRRAALAARIRGDKADDKAEGDADEDAEGEPDADAALAAETEGDPAEPPAEPAPARTVARVPIEALARNVPTESQGLETSQRVKVSASMDVPNFRPGQEFADEHEIAAAMIARQQTLGHSRGGNVASEKIPVAHFDYLDDLKQVTEDRMLNGLLLRKAGEPDALTASGGFCAPAQIVYEFVKVNRPTDLVQDFLPVVGAPRGSIEYPDSPDIRDGFSEHLSRNYTNQNDIDGASKVTAVIDCPSFNTCVVGAEYVILQFGNFGTRAYPEWVEHWVGLSMDVHAHNVSTKLMNQMVALSNAVVPVGPNAGATATIVSNLAMAAADFRHDLRMGRNAQLEVVLPAWTIDLIRSDMARARKGTLETLNITEAQVMGWLSNLNLTVHFVEDWFDTSGLATVGASAWPLGLDFLIYPPGTFVKLDMGTLDLGIVRDSVLNETNDYNIFVESFESVCKPGIESRLYSVSICANGAFSADQNLNCAGVDIPGS